MYLFEVGRDVRERQEEGKEGALAAQDSKTEAKKRRDIFLVLADLPKVFKGDGCGTGEGGGVMSDCAMEHAGEASWAQTETEGANVCWGHDSWATRAGPTSSAHCAKLGNGERLRGGCMRGATGKRARGSAPGKETRTWHLEATKDCLVGFPAGEGTSTTRHHHRGVFCACSVIW